MSSSKKLFKESSSSDSTNPAVNGEKTLDKRNVSEKKKKISSSKKAVKSLTDEEYEDIFKVVLSQPAEDVEKSEDSEGGIEEQNIAINVNPVGQLDQNICALQSAQVLNEATPPVSDAEDKPVKLPPSPIKKKKRFVHKESVNRKQLVYPHKEKQQVHKSPPLCSKKKQRETKTLKDKLLELQSQRVNDNDGTWVQCCRPECSKWRYLDYVKEPFQIPSEWYCSMSEDPERNACDKPETDYSQLEFVFTKYAAGSLVWAKLQGFPWWPAMVDDDPMVEEHFWTNGFSDIPTHYNVVFLDDDVSRAWVLKTFIKPFEEENVHLMFDSQKNTKHQKPLEAALKNAVIANSLPLQDRLKKFSFVARYKGRWPKDIKSQTGKNRSNQNMKLLKQEENDVLDHNADLSEAEEILNQLGELDNLESITSLLDFDSVSEDEFILPSGNQRSVTKTKRPAKLNSRTKQGSAKKLCSSLDTNIQDNKKTKQQKTASCHKKQTHVQNSENTSKKNAKKLLLSDNTKPLGSEEACKKFVKKPKFSIPGENKIKTAALSVTNENKETRNETESVAQMQNEKKLSSDSSDCHSADKVPSSKQCQANTIGKIQKCKLQKVTKSKKKLFCPPKISEANSITKSNRDTHPKDNTPLPQNENITDSKDTCDITSNPLFENGSTESQNSEPFETEE